MATGSEISSVFCAAATMTLPRAPFSQYSRAAEVAVFVSQYSVMLSSTSSFVGDCCGIGAVRPLREARMHEDPRREAGRRVRRAVADRLRPRGHHREVGRVPVLAVRHERFEHRAFLLGESRRRGPAGASAAATSGGTVAGKLMWMPSKPAAAWRAIALEIGAPQSPPWAT